jgi:hypothetical protein
VRAMSDSRLYSVLALAGVTPFVACALLPLAGVDSLGPFGPLDRLAAVYGMAIVSFLTGIHWATQIYAPQESPFNLLLASNVVFLVTWFAFVLGDLDFALGAQALALLVLLGVDRWLHGTGLISRHYLNVRSTATGLAVLSLLAIIILR